MELSEESLLESLFELVMEETVLSVFSTCEGGAENPPRTKAKAEVAALRCCGVMVKLVKKSKVSFLFGVDEICDLTDLRYQHRYRRKASYKYCNIATEGLLGT